MLYSLTQMSHLFSLFIFISCAAQCVPLVCIFSFFFNDTATTEIYTYRHTLSLHDALPISNLKVEKTPKTFSPPTPYSLPELQMAASARWGWSAKKTLDVLQKLYEAGAVTYPRTDAGHLTDEMIPDMPKHLDALKKRDDFRDLANITPVIRKSIFDSKKVRSE